MSLRRTTKPSGTLEKAGPIITTKGWFIQGWYCSDGEYYEQATRLSDGRERWFVLDDGQWWEDAVEQD